MAWAIITIYISKCAQMNPQQLPKTSKFYSTPLGSPKVKRNKTIKHRCNIKNLKERSNELERNIEENLTESEGNSIEERWKRLKENIIESAMDTVGAEERMPAKKPWITREMVDEMEERRKWKHQSTDKARQEYKRLNNKLRRTTEEAREKW